MVYIAKWLWTEPWEQMEGIIGVYSTEESAQKAVDEFLKDRNENDPYDYNDAVVEEWDLHD